MRLRVRSSPQTGPAFVLRSWRNCCCPDAARIPSPAWLLPKLLIAEPQRRCLKTGKHPGQHFAEPMPMQKTGEGQQPGSARDFLIGEADLDGFLGRLEFNELGHCLCDG